MRLGQINYALRQCFYIDSNVIVQSALVLNVEFVAGVPNCLINLLVAWRYNDTIVDIDNEDHISSLQYRVVYP